MRFREKIDLFRPIVCRLLARTQLRRNMVVYMTDAQIQRRSGLPMSTIKRLSWELSWGSASVDELLAFTSACGVDLDNPASVKKHTRYLRQGDWNHILRSPERAHFEELYTHWQKECGR